MPKTFVSNTSLLFQPIDIASLVFFRVVFGILAFADILSSFAWYHLHENAYDPKEFQFNYYGFEWVGPLPEPFMSIFFIVMLFISIAIVIGYRYVLATTLFAFGFTYTFLLEKAHYLNHGYLFCWISFVMIALPAHRAFSVDIWRKPHLYRRSIPFWSLAILPFLMGIVYFFGGIAKINPDWLQAMPLKIWLGRKSDLPVIGPVLGLESTAYFMAYGGLLLDLLVVAFLLNKRTRIWAFGCVLFFHFMNHLVFNIGIFPFLSIALTALYFSPSFPRRMANKLQKRFAFFRRIGERWEQRLNRADSITQANLWQEKLSLRPWIIASLIVVATIHCMLPLRHHFYPGDVAWTEEGHRYSWRMMLRTKSGIGDIKVRFADGAEKHIDSDEYLSRKQFRKMLTHPDMILQFAHHIRDEYLAQGDTVAIFANIRVRLNGKERQFLVDPAVDLAKIEWQHFRHSDWIVPLESQNEKE